MEIDIEHLRQWIGNSETSIDNVNPGPVAALRATLDLDDGLPRLGEVLPPLWHWLYFLEHTRQGELAENGHDSGTTFLPPAPFARRMYAGNTLQFHQPLRIGDEVSRTSTIDDVSSKQGKSGPLLFVKVKHAISNQDGLAITEYHDIVYREPPVTAQESAHQHTEGEAAWSQEFVTDSRLLFRYSALTFNTHRIHYDQPYTTEVEGYPGLLVHGPLLATLLLQSLQQHRPDAVVQSFRFRALHAIYNEQPFSLHGRPAPDHRHVRLWVTDQQGVMCVEANAEISEK